MDKNETPGHDLVIISKQTLDLFLGEKNCVDIIAVYSFYYYTAKWQQTNQIKAVDNFVMKGLKMGNISFRKAKDFLVENGLIDSVPRRDLEGKIKGWYIKINFIWSTNKIQKVVKDIDPEELKPTSGEKETNALSVSIINALNANIPEEILSTELSVDKPLEIVTEEVIRKEGELPDNRGNTPIQRIKSIYCDLFRDKYGFEPTLKMAIMGSCIDNLLENKTEFQVSALLISFFEWRGMDGSSDFEANKLIGATHPFSWFYSSINSYETYLRNVFHLKFDDPREVAKFVYNYMINLKK